MALYHTPAEKRESRIEKLQSEIANLEYDRDAQVRTTGFWRGKGSWMLHTRQKKLGTFGRAKPSSRTDRLQKV